MANTISISVLGDVKDINRKLGTVNKQLDGFGKSASKMGGLLKGAFAAVAVGSLFKDIVTGASNAQQSLGATETVFGKFSKSVIASSNAAATKYGLDANTYRENANLLGAVLSNQGVAQDKLASKTEGLIATGSDLAATFGGTTTSAVEALTAAYKGEFDQLERYGVSIKASDVSTLLAARGQDKLKGAALKAAQQIATSDLIAKQSSKSTGAFAKETDTLAHQQQVLGAKVQNVKDKIGSALLPVLTQIAAYVSDTVLPALERFGAWFSENIMPKIKEFGAFIMGTVVPALQQFGTWIQQNGEWLKPIAAGILAIVAAIQIWSAVTKAFAVVQGILNAVMAANPIGILVLAIVGLIAALVYAYKNNETFRKAVQKAWAAIKAAATAVFGFVKSFISGAFSFIKNAFTRYTPLGIILSHWGQIKSFITGAANAVKSAVSSAWNAVKSATTSAFNAVKSFISSVWNGIKSAVKTAVGAVVTTVRGIKASITGIFSGAAGWLVNAGRNILQGLLRGITDMIGKIKNKLNEVTNLIPDWKGPADKDKNLLRNAGQLIMGGLINGIDDKTTALKKQLKGVTRIIEGTDVGSVGGGAMSLAVAGGAGAAPASVTYNIYDASDPKKVVDAIKAYERNNGAGWRR